MAKRTDTGKRGITPKEFAKRGLALIKKHADPGRARQVHHYFKEEVKSYGLPTPVLRTIEKNLFALTERSWTAEQALEVCEILLPRKSLEEKGLALVMLRRFEKKLDADFIATAERWLSKNYCDSWAIVDALCPWIVGTVIDNHPGVIPKVVRWTSSRNRWLRRASAVSFVILARRGKHLDTAYRVAMHLFRDKDDDLVHKANGWMLRQAGDANMARLERFLLDHGPDIPRTTLRYAIEHFPERKRKTLLVRTKA